MSAIDYIGSKRISIRRDSSETIAIVPLRGDRALVLDAEEWFDLVALVIGIKAATDFREEYSHVTA